MSDVKLLDTENLENKLNKISTALRAKNINYKKYQLNELAENVNNIPTKKFTYNNIASRAIRGDIILNDFTTKINRYAFHYFPIEAIRANNVVTVGNQAFAYCTSLKTMVLKGKNLTFNIYVVRYCSKLEEIRLPNAGTNFGFGVYGLQGCSSLKIIDYGFANSLKFESLSAPNLNTIILHSATKVQALSSGTILNSTKFKEGGEGGTVYIPEVMYNHLGDGSSLDYKASTNWAIYDGYGTITWAKLEGSIYDEPSSIAGLPLPEGTVNGVDHESANKAIITNGNHIHIISNGITGNGGFVLTDNGTYAWTIPENAECTLKIKNLIINSGTLNEKTLSLSNQPASRPVVSVSFSAAGNFEATAKNTWGYTLTSMGLKLYSPYHEGLQDYEFDIELYVNGTRWV